MKNHSLQSQFFKSIAKRGFEPPKLLLLMGNSTVFQQIMHLVTLQVGTSLIKMEILFMADLVIIDLI